VGSSVAGSKSDGFFVVEQLKEHVYLFPYGQMTLSVAKKVGSREKWSIQTYYGEFKRISSVALPSALKRIQAACTTCRKYESPIFQNNFTSCYN